MQADRSTGGSLGRLGLNYVDLLFCHRADLHTPVEETVRAMNHVIDQGKALYWGTSEWPAERIEAVVGTRPSPEQDWR